MTPEQGVLLIEARDSVSAAKALDSLGYHGYAASRAYFAMFYVAEAFLLDRALAFSKHSAVHAAFGQHFVKPGVVPGEFLKYLYDGMDVRHAGDYRKGKAVSPDESAEQIRRAELFLKLAEENIGPIPAEEDRHE